MGGRSECTRKGALDRCPSKEGLNSGWLVFPACLIAYTWRKPTSSLHQDNQEQCLNKETLGARLLRTHDEMRRQRYESAVELTVGSNPPATKVEPKDLRMVQKLLDSAKTRLGKCIKLGVPKAEVILGTDSEGFDASTKSAQGIEVLKAACWPMNILQGVLLADNPFHSCWQDLEQWAAGEELAVSLRAELDEFAARTVYHLVARPT
jgi:hypothetical protein